jgi:hypothetical protein
MSFSDALSVTYVQTPGTTAAQSTITLTGDAQNNLDLVVNANAVVNANVSIIKNNLQSLLIMCDQTITLKTFGTSFPQDTLNISANVPYVWTVNTGTVFACPLTNNIVAVQVNNTPSAVACNFKLRSCLNN